MNGKVVLVGVAAVGVLLVGLGVSMLTPRSEAEVPSVAESPPLTAVGKNPTGRRLVPSELPHERNRPKPKPVKAKKKTPNIRIPTRDDSANVLDGLDYTQPTEGDLERLGVPEKYRDRGILITKVHPDSSGAQCALKKDDVIIKAHKTVLRTEQDMLDTLKGRDHTLLEGIRDGVRFQTVIQKPWRYPVD